MRNNGTKNSTEGDPPGFLRCLSGAGFQSEDTEKEWKETFKNYCPRPDGLLEKKIENVISATKNWKFAYGNGRSPKLDDVSPRDIRTIPHP